MGMHTLRTTSKTTGFMFVLHNCRGHRVVFLPVVIAADLREIKNGAKIEGVPLTPVGILHPIEIQQPKQGINNSGQPLKKKGSVTLRSARFLINF